MMKGGKSFKDKHVFPKFTENKKSTKTTSWYTHPQPGSIEGQGQTEKVKATEESHSGAVNNGKKPKKVQPADTEEYKVCLYRNQRRYSWQTRRNTRYVYIETEEGTAGRHGGIQGTFI